MAAIIDGDGGPDGAFLLDLSDRLRGLDDPNAILGEAAAAVGVHLNASRAGYAEVEEDGDTFVIEGDWTDGTVEQGTGRRSIAAFGPEVAASLRRGETQRYEDARIDPRVPAAHRAAFEEMTIAAIVTVPLVKAGRLVAMFSVQKSRPCAWRNADVRLVEEVAERTWAAYERAKATARLRESEATFGFLLRLSDRVRRLSDPAEMLAASLDLLGRELDVDRAGYAEIDGAAGVLVIDRDWTSGRLPSIVGHHPIASFGRNQYRALARGETICVADTERSPHVDEENRPIHDALTIRASISVPLVREQRLVALLSVQSAAPRAWKPWEQRLVEQVAERTWAALEQAHAEGKLRDTQSRQSFLLALGDRVRRLSEPADVLAASNEMLGVQLGANRVGYAEIDPADADMILVAHDWTDGTVPSVVGRHSFLAFGERHCALLRRGGIFRLDDADDGALTAAELPAYRAMSIQAAVSVPLIKQDRLIAVLSVHLSRPRSWTDAEVLLMQEVAERTWAALEQSRAEAERRETESLLQAFVENAPVGMYLKDPEGRYVIVNDEMAKVLGVPRGEAIGKTALEVLGGDEAGRIDEEERRAFAECRAQVRDQFFPARRDHSSAQLFRFPVLLDGRPPRIGGFAIDTTERLRGEAELALSREALYQSEKLTALGSLLAGVSHELNNPLAVVVGQSMMLEEDAAGTLHAERAGKVRRSAERCAKIVQTFLAMARQRPPERARVDANAVVRTALDLTSYGLRSAGIVVHCALAPDLPPLYADADQLHQVLANLFVNAQQALQDIDGPRRLDVSTRVGPGDTVELEVADNGPGVSPEVRRRVFEPFFTTKPQGVGTGLGLSFSLGVAEAHGGRLELLDRGEGATFLLTLPAAEAAAPVRRAAPAAFARPEGRGHALVVDDEEEIADMLAELLEAQGFRVRLAGSGAEAKRQLAARDFDLILSDLRMPDVDGPALHAWIAAERPALLDRLGFVTGDTLGPNAMRFLADAGRPTLEKPFTPAGLRAFVASVRQAGAPPTAR